MRRLGLFERLESRLPLAADITTGLVHHWTFDETTGDTAIDSAGNSDGTLINWTPTEPKWEPGRIGGALRFGSGDNYVIAPQQPSSGTYSVSFWLNVAERSGIHPRILNYRFGNIVYINNEIGRGVSFSANETANTFSSEPPTFNTWEHYAINFNAATGQGVIYRSGAPVAIGTFIDSAPMPSWTMGHHFDITNHDQSLRGALDDLRVYDRLLTDEDIAELASLGTPEPVHQEPVHHWTFDETTGFTANDIAGGADGTLINWNQTEPRWEPGKVGGALRFSTDNNAVVTPPLGTGAQWSIAFWLFVTTKSGLNPRILTGPDTGTWAYLYLEDDRGMSFFTSRSTNTFDPTPVTTGIWTHYAINFDTIGDVGTIFRNGRPVVSGLFADNAPAVPWVFGHNNDLNNPLGSLDGLLDDLRYYDRLLTTAEIQALAQVAVNDAYTTNEDTLLSRNAAQGLLANDTNASPGSKTTVEIAPLHGEVLLNEDGSFTYDPNDDYNGPDSFTYRLTDPQGNFLLATVAFTINPVNDAPSFEILVDQFLTSDEQPRVFRANGDPVPSTTFPEWTGNHVAGPPSAADEADQTLTLSVSNDNNALFADQPFVDHNRKLYFTPAPNVSGTAILTVTLKDNGGTALGGVDNITQTIQITVVKPHPRLNVVNSQDVVPDGTVAPGDALEIINFLNAFGSQPVSPQLIGPPYFDPTGDNVIAADDALEIINALNANGGENPDLPGAATFLNVDLVTQGSWQGKYGSSGYALNSAQTTVLPDAEISFTGALTDLYDGTGYVPTTDPRALQIPGTTDRIAASWVGDCGFTLDINLPGGQSRQVALYMLDSGRNGRSQRLEVIDATTGQVLDTRDVSDFGEGIYLVWSLRGHVKIRFSNLANGLNATLSSIFFG